MSVLDELRWHKFKCLDDGFVCLVDVMGDDAAVVQAARVSYGQDIRENDSDYNIDTTDFPKRPCNTCGSTSNPQYKGVCNKDCIPESEGLTYYEHKRTEKDRGLLRYMMRHNHGSPFEMSEIKLLVRVPMDTWRQWVRHRTANINEYSTRYSEAIDSAQRTEPTDWRLQSKSNKQGSSGRVTEWPDGWSATPQTDGDVIVKSPDGVLGSYPGCCDTPGGFMSWMEDAEIDANRKHYEMRLALGVAREQARKNLPLSTYTELYWKIDLRNLLHFLGLRMDGHAQQEIREYATTIGEQIVKPLFPLTWEAFVDYRLEAMQLSRLDILAIRRFVEDGRTAARAEYLTDLIPNDRERTECVEKLVRLGFVR